MNLYILRHGEAGEAPTDTGRRLTAAGRAEVAQVARLLRRRGVKFTAIITSPLVRAVETAEIIADALDARDAVRHEACFAHGCDLDDVRAALSELPADASVLLVGHEPNWSRLVAALTGGSVRMATGGLARVDARELAPREGVLRWLLPPPVLSD